MESLRPKTSMVSKKLKKKRLNKMHVFTKFRWAPNFEIACSPSDVFYNSIEWKRMRLKVLTLGNYKCVVCGVTRFESVLHVDHIRPRYLHPEKAFELRNLQILCKQCHEGKFKMETKDFRPKIIVRKPNQVK